MKKIAIDVVLLPPKKISDWCAKFSQQHSFLDKRPFPLNTKDNLPHISLYMGVTNLEDLPVLIQQLQKIAKEVSKIKIKVIQLEKYKIAGCGLKIYRSSKLQKLHEKVVKEFSVLTGHASINKMYYRKAGEFVDVRTSNHLNHFLEKYSFKNFYPHITLRTGYAEVKKLPVEFMAGILAVCHMGSLSTSRKILYKTTLKK